MSNNENAEMDRVNTKTDEATASEDAQDGTPEGTVQTLISAIKRGSSRLDWRIRAVTLALPVALLSVVIVQPWVDAELMFFDPLTAAELTGESHVYYGFVSMLGVMVWTITTAVCLFAAVLLGATGRLGPTFRFALLAGLLTGWLTLDDSFLVHEKVLPAIGVPQNLALAVIVALTVAYVVVSWRTILASDFWLLVVGAVAFAGSIGIDTVLHSVDPVFVQLEDSAKFVGIFCWASFHVTTLTRFVVQALGSADMPSA